MDNYSRYIHNWKIERVVSAKIRLNTIQEALTSIFEQENPKFSIQLVTDGGSENDNNILKTFMAQNSSVMHHTIALKDIEQSNSMMEAFYYTTKYARLYAQQIADGK